MDERIWLKNYDKGIPADVQCDDGKPYDFLKRSAEKFPDRTALVFFNYKISYENLMKKVNSFANYLAKMGINAGDRVALDLPNSPQYVIAFYAINKIGGIVVQISPTYFEVELEHIMGDSKAKAIIILDDLIPRLENVRKKEDFIIIGTSIEEYLRFPLNFLYGLQRRMKKAYTKIPDYAEKFQEGLNGTGDSGEVNDRNAVAVLQYTGGTTGIPKGAMLTNSNLVCNTIQSVTTIPGLVDGKDTMLSAIPFFHVFGMTVAMNFPVKIGATIVLQPKPEIDGMMKLIKKYKPRFFPGVPTIYINILNHKNVKNLDLKPVEYCISGSAPLPVDVIQKWVKVTGGHLVEGYGLSEASPVTHINPIYGKIKDGSIGIPLSSTYAKIVDAETGSKEMPVGQEGELIIKGPQVMKGYWNQPQETANTLRDGWLFTGDIAKMDEDGYFYIVDRKKDVIIVGGFNVYPREVEEILYQHPKVKEAAVVGSKDEVHGEIVKAFVVLKEGETCSEQEIKDFFQGKIAKFKIPRIVEFRKDLPKTMVGKVLRRELRNN